MKDLNDSDPLTAAPRGRVIFVDDEPGIRQMMTELLQGSYEVETVCDAKSALASIQRCLPDIIITDIRMPGLSGFDLLKAIRLNPRTKRIPVILLSGNQDEASRVQGFEMGAVDYLTKPFSPQELLTRIAAHLHSALEALHLAEQLVGQRTAELEAANKRLSEEISNRKRLETEILNLTEKERRCIGLELHDGVCQNLIAVHVKNLVLTQVIKNQAPEIESQIDSINQVLAQTILEARRIARGLCPIQLESLGFIPALRELATHTQRFFSIQCFCDFQETAPVLDLSVAHHVYRIAQEAISNALKHANAKKIWIEFGAQADRIILTIRNDGRPFPNGIHSSSGMGLRLMTFRAELLNATLTIKSDSEMNTAVTCSFPHPAEVPASIPNSTFGAAKSVSSPRSLGDRDAAEAWKNE